MILGQAYLVRRYVGTWLFPACLFGLFWFGYTFFPLAVLFWVPVHPYAIGFIFLCAVAFSLGSVPFDWKTAFKRNAQKRDTVAQEYGSPFLRYVFYLTTVTSVIFVILNLSEQGFSLHDLFFDLLSTAAAYMGQVETLNINNFDRFSIIFAYLGASLGGFLFSCVPTKFERRMVVLLSFFPPILVAVAESTKGLLFLCIAFFYAGLLVQRASVGKLRLLEKVNIKWLIACVAVLMLVITTAFLLRGLYTTADEDEIINRLISSYASYACGHIYAFSDWFSFIAGGHSELTYFREGTTHGFYTFMALFKLMGSHKVVPEGVFDDYYSYRDLLTSNIFTMFRGLITDFGFIGSIVFMLTSGLLIHKAFQVMLLKKRPVFTVVVFVFMMGYFYSSFIVSVLIWNRVCIALVLLWIVLQINRRVAQRAIRRLAFPGTVGKSML